MHKFPMTLLLAGLTLTIAISPQAEEHDDDNTLRGPDAFQQISGDEARSQALFEEIGKVLQHPRCLNCHPVDDRPLQGDQQIPHEPRVLRGYGGIGYPGMLCNTCHGRENVPIEQDWAMPGHPKWHLAPASMGWVGKNLAEICDQIKDPERNGGKTLNEIVEHMAEDDLVAWGWEPGAGREPAPGDQETLGALTRAWVEAGAHCPQG